MRLFLIFASNFQAFTFSRDIYAYKKIMHIGEILGQWTQKCGFKKDFTPLVPNLRNISMEANSGGKPNSEM